MPANLTPDYERAEQRYRRAVGDGRFSGQHVHRTECLKDKDVVEIHQ